MTAEIAILNRLGIALASDSAVTLGGTETKIYTSADKLFLLSEQEPIGAMIYGASTFLDVPWETIIKMYRRESQENNFTSVEQCAADFLAFIQGNRSLFSEESQREFVRWHCTSVYDHLWRGKFGPILQKAIEDEGELTADQVQERFDNYLEQVQSEFAQLDNYSHLPDDVVTEISEQYTSTAESAIDDLFVAGTLTEHSRKLLVRIGLIALVKSSLDMYTTGLVIAGFGADEHFPRLVEFHLRGAAANHLLYCQERRIRIGIDAEAAVVPFAQQEMVSTFMDGVDPSLRSLFEESSRALFSGIAVTILDEVKAVSPEFGNELEERVTASLDPTVSQLFAQWNERCRQYYSDPVVNIVMALPKDELGAMAESLVNLTKFKRRVSLQQETVGGPIDVAVITKGDGFVWIQRKHYLRAELNQRFVARYVRGG